MIWIHGAFSLVLLLSMWSQIRWILHNPKPDDKTVGYFIWYFIWVFFWVLSFYGLTKNG